MAIPKTEQPEQVQEPAPAPPQPAARTATLHKITAIRHDILHPITGKIFKLNQTEEVEDVDSALQAQIRAGLMSLG